VLVDEGSANDFNEESLGVVESRPELTAFLFWGAPFEPDWFRWPLAVVLALEDLKTPPRLLLPTPLCGPVEGCRPMDECGSGVLLDGELPGLVAGV
jgi:hypothetical protein